MKLNKTNYKAIFIFVILYITALISLYIKTGFDTYWHIKVGEWIVNHQKIPATGLFSLTKENDEWIAHSWLSEVIIYLFYKTLGWPGLGLMAITSVTISIFIMLHYLFSKLSPSIVLILMLFSYGMLAPHVMPRPHILALPFMTFWLWQMLKATESSTPPPLWLIVISALWSNLHGSFFQFYWFLYFGYLLHLSSSLWSNLL